MPKKPAKKVGKPIIAFRLPDDIIDALTATAKRVRVSRNKMVEFILAEHLRRTDADLAAMVTAEKPEPAATADLFD